jgi:hypothetical protein
MSGSPLPSAAPGRQKNKKAETGALPWHPPVDAAPASADIPREIGRREGRRACLWRRSHAHDRLHRPRASGGAGSARHWGAGGPAGRSREDRERAGLALLRSVLVRDGQAIAVDGGWVAQQPAED